MKMIKLTKKRPWGTAVPDSRAESLKARGRAPLGGRATNPATQKEESAESDRPWERMEPTITPQTIRLTAVTYRIEPDDLLKWFDAYQARFRQGPVVFIPWYNQQRAFFENGMLVFEPYYPHECYAQLLEMDTSWLYDHPAWGRA